LRPAGFAVMTTAVLLMLVAFARYSRESSFVVLRNNIRFVVVLGLGSITGAMVGGLLLGVIPDLVLIPILAAVLLVSAVKLARHD
jgi:uncharacterized membrane protein YfcA